MFNKKNLIIISSILCIILLTFSKIFITNGLFLLKENFSNDIFIDREFAYDNIIRSKYFKNLNEINLKARGCNNLDECKDSILNGLDYNQYLELIQNNKNASG